MYVKQRWHDITNLDLINFGERMKCFKKIKQYPVPIGVVFILSCILLAINIIFIGHIRPFNSDDLYWQLVVSNWHPLDGDTLYFGAKDIFVILAPFFWIMSKLFALSRSLLILGTLLLTLGSFVLYFSSSLFILKKISRVKAVHLVPFVWLGSFGYALVSNYLNASWRSFEMGLSFATVALVVAFTMGSGHLAKPRHFIIALIAVLLNALLAYSDPYYTFFTIVPLILFITLLRLKNILAKQPYFTIIYLTFGVFFLSKVFSLIGEKMGVFINTNAASVFMPFENLIDSLMKSLHALLVIFGADFFGREAGDIVTFGLIINAIIFMAVIVAAFRIVKGVCNTKKPISLSDAWRTFFPFSMFFVFLVFTSSTLSDVNNYRFYIYFVYCGVFVLSLMLSLIRVNLKKWNFFVVLVIGTSIIFNSWYTYFSGSVYKAPEVIENPKNQINRTLISAIESRGLTKGYGNYWQGNINTYLSRGKVTFLPVVCDDNGRTMPFKWLVTESMYLKKSSKSFLLIDPYFKDPKQCTVAQLEAQFGAPEGELKIKDKTVLFYNYDIAERL